MLGLNAAEQAMTMDYQFENLGDERFQQLCQALEAAVDSPELWEQTCNLIRTNFQAGLNRFYDPFVDASGERIDGFPYEIAKRVATSPKEYPRWLVSCAQERCRLEVAARAIPVSQIAKREGWFPIGSPEGGPPSLPT